MKYTAVLFSCLVMASLTLSACDSSVNSGSYHYLSCFNCSNASGDCESDQSKCAGGCTTGDHQLDSLDSYCKTLKDSSQNNGCAADVRLQMFQNSGCSGSFSEN